jgi:hypothetical protein
VCFIVVVKWLVVVLLLVEEKDSVAQQISVVAQDRLQAREEGATVTYEHSAAEVHTNITSLWTTP